MLSFSSLQDGGQELKHFFFIRSCYLIKNIGILIRNHSGSVSPFWDKIALTVWTRKSLSRQVDARSIYTLFVDVLHLFSLGSIGRILAVENNFALGSWWMLSGKIVVLYLHTTFLYSQHGPTEKKGEILEPLTESRAGRCTTTRRDICYQSPTPRENPSPLLEIESLGKRYNCWWLITLVNKKIYLFATRFFLTNCVKNKFYYDRIEIRKIEPWTVFL